MTLITERTTEELSESWMIAKNEEKLAVALRRDIEDELSKRLKIADNNEESSTVNIDGFKIKVSGRMNRKVDGDKLQDIALEAGLSDHLSTLFRWKPEINKKAWDNADEEITKPLLGAITTTPGRTSFNIAKIEE